MDEPDNDAKDNSLHCPHCHYDMSGQPTSRCPECGQTLRFAKDHERIKATGRVVFFAGILLFASSISMAILLMGGSVMGLVNGPTIFHVVLPGAALTLAAVGWRGIAAVPRSFFVRKPKTADIACAVLALRLGAVFFLASGTLGMMLGLIAMLGSMDDPSAAGPSMAVALLSVLYGATLSVILLAASFALLRQGESSQAFAASEKVANRAIGTAAAFAVVSVGASLLAFTWLATAYA